MLQLTVYGLQLLWDLYYNLLLVQGRDVQVPDWDALAAVGGFDGAYLELDDRWRRVE